MSSPLLRCNIFFPFFFSFWLLDFPFLSLVFFHLVLVDEHLDLAPFLCFPLFVLPALSPSFPLFLCISLLLSLALTSVPSA